MYTTVSAVRARTGTKMTDEQIAEHIAQAELEVDAALEYNGLEVPSIVPKSLQLASLYWSCRNVLQAMKHRGDQPNSFSVEGVSVSVNIDQTIADYDAKGLDTLCVYLRSAIPWDSALIVPEGDLPEGGDDGL